MDPKYGALFTPWKIGNVEIKNRIVLCPMGGTSLFSLTELGGYHFDKEAANFYLHRASNHVGLIVPGMAPVRHPLFSRWLWQNEKMFNDLNLFMDELHRAGAKLFIQLSAGMGRAWAISDEVLPPHRNKLLHTLAKPVVDTGYPTASPSRLPSPWAPGGMTREMTAKEIHEIVDAFSKTAVLCKHAGVDGIEVHGLHGGSLLDQFAMSYTNYRTDTYGGSFENRYRFSVEIVQAIKAACGDDFPVSLRYSVRSMMKDFGVGGLPGQSFWEAGRNMKESERAARYLQDAGYDMLNADNGALDSWYWTHPPIYMPENCNLSDVAHIKQFVDIPVVCAGRMNPETGAQAVAEGRIDGMGVARQFLADPEWVTKLRNDRLEDIRPCTYCNCGCLSMPYHKGHADSQTTWDPPGSARCALNPETMQSKKYHLKPAKKPKKIHIIGGGIGGMEAALVCAKRGHNVTLYEKSNRLGGAFIAASALSFKERNRQLLKWYEREIAKYPIIVKLGRRVEENAYLMAEETIIATGAIPYRPRVKGMELGIDATDFLLGKKEVGQNVTIIGGGQTGCEIAYELYLQGKKPTIVEIKEDLLATSDVCLANSSFLRDFLDANQVPVHLQTRLREIHADGISVTGKDGNLFKIPSDSVIFCTGYIPAPLDSKSGRIHLVGDCSQVGNLHSVIRQAWDVAMKL